MSTKQKNGRDQPSLQRKDTTVNEAQSVAVIGGTGDLGGGLAIACARARLTVYIGSRDAARAAAAAAEISAATGATVEGMDNLACATKGDIVAVTVPFASQVSTLKTASSSTESEMEMFRSR